MYRYVSLHVTYANIYSYHNVNYVNTRSGNLMESLDQSSTTPPSNLGSTTAPPKYQNDALTIVANDLVELEMAELTALEEL